MTEVPAPPKEKTLADLTKDQQAEIKTGEEMDRLVTSEVWKFYDKVLQAQLAAKRNEMELATPLAGEGGEGYAFRMAILKGTIIGLRLALEQPSIMIQVGRETRDRLLGKASGD